VIARDLRLLSFVDNPIGTAGDVVEGKSCSRSMAGIGQFAHDSSVADALQQIELAHKPPYLVHVSISVEQWDNAFIDHSCKIVKANIDVR
jgi:hypothetical protein